MRIAEVVEEYGLSADTLRYYERIGLLRPVRRNASGVRDYGEEDCARISFVKCMRGANVSIEALIEYMQLFDEGDSMLEARRQILIEQRDAARERLQRIQAGLDRLDYKIAHYDELIAQK
ncbi:MerR family transcriptional regulator [uncultured Collinsella sp.]|uniref:MerR family transcriptional regulator n=1 Tax=uncultured Collinsella sp. TaxID=165190 RepID=UPI0025D6922B|nr:MerR family transcriptional regulator [uncultured Collinsella sp.]